MYQECENLICYYNLYGLCENEDVLNSKTGQCIYFENYVKIFLKKGIDNKSNKSYNSNIEREVI